MAEELNMRDLNRQAAYHNRLNRAQKALGEMLAIEGLAVCEADISLENELRPPLYTDEEIQDMALNGLRVVSTGYSQHVFKISSKASVPGSYFAS